jgi:hypothetical protein
MTMLLPVEILFGESYYLKRISFKQEAEISPLLEHLVKFDLMDAEWPLWKYVENIVHIRYHSNY